MTLKIVGNVNAQLTGSNIPFTQDSALPTIIAREVMLEQQSIPLESSAVWTSDVINVSKTSGLYYTVNSSAAGASFIFQDSTNGTDWVNGASSNLTASTSAKSSISSGARYMRLVVTNGANATNIFVSLKTI